MAAHPCPGAQPHGRHLIRAHLHHLSRPVEGTLHQLAAVIQPGLQKLEERRGGRAAAAAVEAVAAMPFQCHHVTLRMGRF